MAKANPVAGEGLELAVFPDDAAMFDGSPVNPHSGGVVSAGGEWYSLSVPELVTDGEKLAEGGLILARRAGHITLPSACEVQATTYGGEVEFATVDEHGNYTDRFGFDLELYRFMTETSTRVGHSPEDMARAYEDMAVNVVAEAEGKGVLLSPLGVFGQRALTHEDASQHPYVQQVVKNMDNVTGFSAVDMFRVAGWQPHTRLSNLRAGLQAAEAMQLLNPILTSPSLSGPFLVGGSASRLAHASFGHEQYRHLKQAGITREDMRGGYQSYRYMLRRVGSPSAGIWQKPAPDSVEAYLADADAQLDLGEINTIDRFRGWHADRIRTVFNQSGATTFEGCSYDPFAGNLTAITDNHVLHSAVFTALEAKALRGDDVVAEVSRELGIDHLPRQDRLNVAHRAMLEVSRHGNDAEVYGKRPGEWLVSSVLPLADRAPHIEIGQDRRLRLVGNFATMMETVPALRQWCAENRSVPTVQAYHELGINNPAVYMREHFQQLHGPAADRVRQVELSVAQVFHARVGQLAFAK